MATKTNSPDNTSTAYDIMQPYWLMVDTILAGTLAMRAAGELYLPRFEEETDARYQRRLLNTKFTNIYRDVVENLAAKPMAKEVAITEGSASPRITDLCEDIDGAGNNLHVFASKVLYDGINKAIDWIYVDYPKSRPGMTVAQEKSAGLRPYWVHIAATDMLAVYSARIGDSEEFVHARWREIVVRQEGFIEVERERIRVVERIPTEGVDELGNMVVTWGPPIYSVYERVVTGTGTRRKSGWSLVDQGPITLGVIPLTPFIAGRRVGSSWVVVPPMQDCAYLQIEHYQQESGVKNARILTAFPMLSASGVTPELEDAVVNGKKVRRPVRAPVGPEQVLYAPPNKEGQSGEWKFIEITATSLRFLADDVKATEQQLRELGRQPLTAQTGNLTVVTTAFAADKANSVAQAWTLNLKDCLEMALYYTALWLRDPSEPEVSIDVDFDIGIGEDQGPTHVISLYDKGVISKMATRNEMKRYGVLSAEYDGEKDDEQILEEDEDDTGEEEGDALSAAIAALRTTRPAAKKPDPNTGDPDDDEPQE